MEEEVWKDIYFTDFDGILHDYRGKYQISNKGRLRGFADKHGKIHKEPVTYFNPQPQSNGYICFHLRDGKGNNKYVKAHKIVAFMFIPIPKELLDIEEKLVINHKNEIKHDNRIENLEWCTSKYNTNYGTCIERRSKKLKGHKTTLKSRKKMSIAQRKRFLKK